MLPLILCILYNSIESVDGVVRSFAKEIDFPCMSLVWFARFN